jgi:putative DNA primase/helicase
MPFHEQSHQGCVDRIWDRWGDLIRRVPDPASDTGRGTWYAWDEDRGVWVEGAYSIVHGYVQQLRDIVRQEIRDSNFLPTATGGMTPAEKAYWTFHARVQSSGYMDSIMKVMGQDARFRCSHSDFNRHVDLFVVGNGTLVFESDGEVWFRPSDPSDMMTVGSPVIYDPSAKCPFFEASMELFLPDPEVRRFVHRGSGYSMLGGQNEECLFCLHGEGANGKSTYVDSARVVFGDDLFLEVTPKVFGHSRRDAGSASPDLISLKGRRFVSLPEADSAMDTELVKRVTGGDWIRARGMYQGEQSFRPDFTLWMQANAYPSFDDHTFAMWRRIYSVEWTVKMDKSDPRHVAKDDVKRILASEASGILNWYIAGYRAYRTEGLNPPASVVVSTMAMRESSDWFAQFIDESIVEEVGFVRRSDLWKAFNVWRAGDPVLKKVTKSKFNTRVASVWGEATLNKGEWGWKGRSLKVNVDWL